jgi:hypothetical protein
MGTDYLLVESMSSVSHSNIMDQPVYPDDLVPAYLRGGPMLNGWFPWIYGICKDDTNNPVIFYISINIGFGGPRCGFIIKGTPITANFDTSTTSYSDGIYTIGTMPKITIDYQHLTIRIDFNVTTYITINLSFRGIPLWYSKTSNVTDMLRATKNLFFGGYDVPMEVNGQAVYGRTTVLFSGYGDWQHTWLVGNEQDWAVIRAKWITFNDPNYCGAIAYTHDPATNEILTKTGRFTSLLGASFTFDDFQWLDDGLQPPEAIRFNGNARDTMGNIQLAVSLIGSSTGHEFNSELWTQFNVTGQVNSDTFDGSSWSEFHNNIPETTASSILGLLVPSISIGTLMWYGLKL